tara:strand:+ start:12692 stop:13495 length:804 start_codon:yes stop_codon:yes gene_type:complete
LTTTAGIDRVSPYSIGHPFPPHLLTMRTAQEPPLMSEIPMMTPETLKPSDLLREWRLLKDLAAYAADRSLSDLPRGQASVMVIPGFGAGDWATGILRGRLSRLGHHVYGWGLGINRGQLGRDAELLLPRLQAIVARRDQPVTLIGWSLGGVIARQVARQQPGLVNDIIALGTPLVGGPKFTFTAPWYARKGMDLDAMARKVDDFESSHALPCPLLSVFTPHDGMVHPGASHDPHHPEVTYREVDASHLGLCLAPEVIEIIALRLARA